MVDSVGLSCSFISGTIYVSEIPATHPLRPPPCQESLLSANLNLVITKLNDELIGDIQTCKLLTYLINPASYK